MWLAILHAIHAKIQTNYTRDGWFVKEEIPWADVAEGGGGVLWVIQNLLWYYDGEYTERKFKASKNLLKDIRWNTHLSKSSI